MSDTLLTQAEIDALLPQLTKEKKETSPADRQAETAVNITENETAGSTPEAPSHQQIERILDIPLRIKVELGDTTKTIQDVLSFIPGSIVEFERSVSNPVNIMLNDKLIARGEVVIVDEHFGVRITQIVTMKDRLQKMG